MELQSRVEEEGTQALKGQEVRVLVENAWLPARVEDVTRTGLVIRCRSAGDFIVAHHDVYRCARAPSAFAPAMCACSSCQGLPPPSHACLTVSSGLAATTMSA